MNAIAAIRTHRWTGAEARLLTQLRAAFGGDVCVVFHDRSEDIELPCDVVDVTSQWAQAQELRTPRDWGWRCGDYFLYALRAAKPGYDHYWLVEPDVHFYGDPKGFFDRFAEVDADLLGLDPEPLGKARHMFTATMPDMAHWRAIFALTRISGRALDLLLPLRVENGKVPVGPMRVANDEVFVYSHAVANSALSVGNLRDHAPDWFEGVQFDTAPDLLEEAMRSDPELQGKVLHPVHDKTSFKEELAKRVARKLNFMGNLGKSWDHLTNDDLEEIADDIRIRSLKAMEKARRQSQNERQRPGMEKAAE